MSTEELAKAAYETYAEHTAWKNFWGGPVPSWASLAPKLREAWIAVVQRVVHDLEGEPVDIQLGDEP
jgi:hypothetical protein